jgi:TRAP-type C4-dicarboxylate transport system substrate-binding protein
MAKANHDLVAENSNVIIAKMRGGRMVRLRILVLVVFLFVTFTGWPALRAISPCEASDDPIELSLAHFWPAKHYLHTEQVVNWIAEIEKATNGRVKIRTYPAETLLKMKEMYQGVVDGIADVGIGVFALSYGRHPLMEVFELPGLNYPNATAAAVVSWEGYKRIKELKLSDAKLLYTFCTGPGAIWATTPIRRLEDMKGLEIMAPGSTSVIMKRLDAVPVGLPRPEVYIALKKGIVKAAVGPFEALKGFREAEVTKYLTIVPRYYNKVFFVTMNLDKWNSLPNEIQVAFDQVNDGWAEKAGKIWDSHQEEGFEFAMKQGMEVIELSPEELARWMARLVPIRDQFIGNMEAKGLPGRESVEIVTRLCDQYAEKYK